VAVDALSPRDLLFELEQRISFGDVTRPGRWKCRRALLPLAVRQRAAALGQVILQMNRSASRLTHGAVLAAGVGDLSGFNMMG
jgi:hypothetical protein